MNGRLVSLYYQERVSLPPLLQGFIRTKADRSPFILDSPIYPYFYCKKEDLATIQETADKHNFKIHNIIEDKQARLITGEEAVRVEMYNPHHVGYLRRIFDKEHKVYLYEADIHFNRRLMIDLGIYDGVEVTDTTIKPIKTDLKPRYLFWDIEQWDGDGIPDKNQPIVCLSCVTDDGIAKTFCSDSKEREFDILVSFLNFAKDYDVWIAFYGEEYDLPVLQYRCKQHNIPFNIQARHYLDMWQLYTRSRQQKLEEETLANIAKVENLAHQKINMGMSIAEAYKQDKEKLKEYNLTDCWILHDLEQKKHLVEVKLNLSSICGIPIQDSNYPNRLVDTIVLRKFQQLPTRIVALSRRSGDDIKQDEDTYKAALVFQPIAGLHKNVLHFDFKSLYNRILQAANLSPELYYQFEEHINKTQEDKEPANIINWYSQQPKTIFPQILEELEPIRNKYRTLKEQALKSEDMDKYKDLDMIDLSYKVLLLLFYGTLGQSKSRFFYKPLAEAITWVGRELLLPRTKEFLESQSIATVLGGDSDSFFLSVPHTIITETQLRDIGLNIAKKLGEQLYPNILKEQNIKVPSKIELEFKDAYKELFFGAVKKKYIYRRFNGTIETIGFEIVRSDWCTIAKTVQEQVLKMILDEKSLEDIDLYLTNEKDKLLAGEYNTQLILSEGIRKNLKSYKVKPPNVRAAEKIVAMGYTLMGKVRYMVTDMKKEMLVEPVLPDKPLPVPNKSALAYYWENQIYPPTRRILNARFINENEQYILQRLDEIEPYKKEEHVLEQWIKD